MQVQFKSARACNSLLSFSAFLLSAPPPPTSLSRPTHVCVSTLIHKLGAGPIFHRPSPADLLEGPQQSKQAEVMHFIENTF